MYSFEVIEKIDHRGEENEKISAISFPEPMFIKFVSGMKLKKGDTVLSDLSKVYLESKEIGSVEVFKSASGENIDTSHDIKYTGGYSIDGKTIYLDEHFPPVLTVEGKEIDARKTIGLHHELPEKWMSDEGYEYPYAHEVATGIEKKYVESLGVTWKGYCSEVDRNLRQVYRRTLEKSPPSLDLAPYLYCRDREALNEIRKSE
ncbi:MAG: hypothetical protein M1375_04720 [Candidatus Thermoplasmatota archaeon]|jgi:hypothetical protein|nr:hypothetical protein [Candidatus Thermoplasmatota archaeon]MCL5791255.1 hypothetical protein [Candidatus Thermoplasmatota archaeon]